MSTKVVITTVEAGGGHVAVMDSLYKTLSGHADKQIEVEKFYSKQTKYDKIYRWMARSPQFLEFLHFLSVPLIKAFKPLVISPEVSQSKKMLAESKPDIVLCTHPFQSLVFTTLREKLGLNYQVVTCICDYGDPKEYINYAPQADHYLVRDEETRQRALKYLPPEKADNVFIFGTVVNEAFEEYHSAPAERIEAEFQDLLAEACPSRAAEYDKSKPAVLVVGGSGWVRKSKSLILELAQTGKYNLLVCYGKDDSLREEICDLPGVFCFGFLEQPKLALLERFADVAVLSTLAPATMYELLTINKYPLFVHRYHMPHEAPHIRLLSDWEIGFYEPDDAAMMKRLDDYLANPEKYRANIENEARRCADEKRKAAANYEFILKMAANRPVINLEVARTRAHRPKTGPASERRERSG